MRHEACLLATTLVLSLSSGLPAAERPHPPNIVIILADDLG